MDARQTYGRFLRADLEADIEARIDRCFEADPMSIIPNHHFSAPSAECIGMYRDGYFYGCVTLSQAVAEGIVKFAAERNGVVRLDGENDEGLARRMNRNGLLSDDFITAFGRIRRSFRNDFHHMNRKIEEHPVAALAKRNIEDLVNMERELFEWAVGENGTMVPRHSQYWDQLNGDVSVFVRT